MLATGRFSFPVPRDANARAVAMIVAAMHGRLATKRALLDSGVDVNAAPYWRQTALHYAAYMVRAQVVEELLARGADPSVIDAQTNRTPAQWARELGNSDIADRLEGGGENMNVILFGASGMVGQGVLRECLLDPDVRTVLSIGRSATRQRHPKLRALVHRNFLDFSPIENELSDFDAGFFCLGVSSAGMKEADYRRVTYDFTMAAARVLARLNPGMTFVYVSGAGTDSSEHGRTMWARVKGKTENDLLGLPFKAAYMFRPGLIAPLDGIKSKTKLVRISYAVLGPLLPLLRAAFPKYVTNTQQVGRAMIQVAKHGGPKTLLENSDINELARGAMLS
jgi:hypothetical protein